MPSKHFEKCLLGSIKMSEPTISAPSCSSYSFLFIALLLMRHDALQVRSVSNVFSNVVINFICGLSPVMTQAFSPRSVVILQGIVANCIVCVGRIIYIKAPLQCNHINTNKSPCTVSPQPIPKIVIRMQSQDLSSHIDHLQHHSHCSQIHTQNHLYTEMQKRKKKRNPDKSATHG